MHIAVIVPIYNESDCIQFVFEELFTIKNIRIIAVNDCSSDDSLSKILKYDNITILNLPCNLGVGGAVQTGLRYAKENGFDYAVKFDGDGQHRACDIEKLLEPIFNKEADIAIGSRFIMKNQGFKSTFSRRLGIKTLQMLNYVLTRQNILDITSGFRSYNRKAIEYFAENYPSFDYPEPEELVIALKNNFKLVEVPVTMRERHGGVSSITPLISLYYMIKVILSVIITAIRPRGL